MEENKLHRTDEIELYLQGQLPNTAEFETALRNDPQLAADLNLHRDLAKAFADKRKNHLRQTLEGLSAEYAIEQSQVRQGGATIRHINAYKQYYALAAALTAVLFGLWLIRQTPQNQDVATVSPSPEAPSVEQPNTNPGEQNTPIPGSEIKPNSPKPNEPTAQKPNAPTAKEESVATNAPVKLQDVEARPSVELDASGKAEIAITAQIREESGYKAEEVVVEIAPQAGQVIESQKVKTVENTKVGFVKKDAPQRNFAWDARLKMAPGEYEIRVKLPDGRVLYKQKLTVY